MKEAEKYDASRIFRTPAKCFARKCAEPKQEDSYVRQNVHVFGIDTWWKKLLLILFIVMIVVLVVAIVSGIVSFLAPVLIPLLIAMIIIRLIGRLRS